VERSWAASGRISLFGNWTFTRDLEGKPMLFKTVQERDWSQAVGLAWIHAPR